MKYLVTILLFFLAVAVCTGLSRFSHQKTVERVLTEETRAALNGAGFQDVEVSYDHFDAKLKGFVDSEEQRVEAADTVDEAISGAYVNEGGVRMIEIRPTLQPEITITKKKDSRTAILQGVLGAADEDQKKYLASNLFVINGIDAVENEVSLDSKRKSFDKAADFASLAAELISNSDYSEIALAENGLITLSGMVETSAIRDAIAETAGRLSGGRVENKLEVRPKPIAVGEGPEVRITRSRFGIAVSGNVAFESEKAAVMEVVSRNPEAARIADQLAVNPAVGASIWIQNIKTVIPLLFSNVVGDAEAHYTASRVVVRGEVPSDAHRERIVSALSPLAAVHDSLNVTSELSVVSGSSAPKGPEMSMKFDRNGIVLEGQVPSNILRQSIESRLNLIEEDKRLSVDNRLTVDDSLPPIGWINNVPDLLVEVIKRVSSGSVEFKNSEVALTGTTHGAEEKQIIQNLAVNTVPQEFNVANLLSYVDQPFPSPKLMAAAAGELAESLQSLAVYFDSGVDQVREDQRSKVQEAAEAIRRNAGESSLLVGGYADSRGDAESNRQLSIRRATSVKDLLIEAGVPAEKMRVDSYGEDPVQHPSGEEWKSRRVEIRIVTE